MTPFAIVLATQALDALGLALALPFGRESNPIMAAVLAAGASARSSPSSWASVPRSAPAWPASGRRWPRGSGWRAASGA